MMHCNIGQVVAVAHARDLMAEASATLRNLPGQILNLTQHDASPDQIRAGVVEFRDSEATEILCDLLTFDVKPTLGCIEERARSIAKLAAQSGKCNTAMIGGAPYLMPFLEKALMAVGIQPLYAFSKRESIESVAADGSVTKRTVFRHAGFIGRDD